MFPEDLAAAGVRLLEQLRLRRALLATAESCTGGLLAALMTECPGSSAVFERGFVTYSNEAKAQMLGIAPALIATHGAVSREVALAMAAGALAHSRASLAVAVTGVAGPGGGTIEKPVGLVHIAAASRDRPSYHRECRFGPRSRTGIRLDAVRVAIDLVSALIADGAAEAGPCAQGPGCAS